MKVKRLALTNFRNIRESSFEPGPHINFLTGNNGQGKTSFIEALGYLATLRSFRSAKTDEVVRWGETQAEVRCEATAGDDWNVALSVSFQSLERAEGRRVTQKTAMINGKPYRNSTQYLSQRFGEAELGFHSVVFNPSDHDLVRGEPTLRRSYLDRALAAEDVDFLRILQKYQRVLEQRNAIFRATEVPSSSDRSLLQGFTEPLVGLGARIVLKRLGWISRAGGPLARIAAAIAPAQPFLQLVYVSKWVPENGLLSINNTDLSDRDLSGQGVLPSLETLEQAFWKRLSDLQDAEWRARSSLVGPHRDDWSFFLGRQVLRGHGSQGEIRSALLALKLTEIELFRDHTRQQPLLLLDDFSSELDRDRRAFLLRFLLETDLQVFVTTTEDSFPTGKRFQVTGGMLKTHEHRPDVSHPA